MVATPTPLDELEIARAMRDGALTSPQRVGNLALFAMRVTGTGLAYRAALDEYAWRDPSLYMNADFLERCNGLPLILDHPPKGALNSQEYGARVIGAVFLPYLDEAAQEVWAIVRVHDAQAAAAIERGEFSTSPCVVFSSAEGVGERQAVGDGRKVLIEGRPWLLDHLAVVTTESGGVWDRAGPKGIQVDVRADETGRKRVMTEEARSREDDGKRDDGLAKLDATLGKMAAAFDSVCKRLDQLEAKGKKKGEDGDEEDDDEDSSDQRQKVVEDAARHARRDKATRKSLQDAIRELEAADQSFGEAQARADAVFRRIVGKEAPPPMAAERILDYRKRLLSTLQPYAGEEYAKVPLRAMDHEALKVFENVIYDAATKYDPPIPRGTLRRVEKTSDAGHKIYEYFGDPLDAMAPFVAQPKIVSLRGRPPAG